MNSVYYRYADNIFFLNILSWLFYDEITLETLTNIQSNPALNLTLSIETKKNKIFLFLRVHARKHVYKTVRQMEYYYVRLHIIWINYVTKCWIYNKVTECCNYPNQLWLTNYTFILTKLNKCTMNWPWCFSPYNSITIQYLNF